MSKQQVNGTCTSVYLQSLLLSESDNESTSLLVLVSVVVFQGYDGVRESLHSKKKNSALTVGVDSNMNKKNKKKKEEDVELPSKTPLNPLNWMSFIFCGVMIVINIRTQPFYIVPCSRQWSNVLSLRSHTIPHQHLYRTGERCKHQQQSLCHHCWHESHPDRQVMAGPTGRQEGLWGWLHGELWVAWLRCGGDQKGWGEVRGRVLWDALQCVHTRERAGKYTHVAWSECFSTSLQLGHDGATPESCWLVDELSVAVPTKGVKYIFACKCWLAKDRGDGLTARVFNVLDAEAISISQKVYKHEHESKEQTHANKYAVYSIYICLVQ